MSVTVQEIYDSVCNAMLEPGGFTTGTYTENRFLASLGNVLSDFCQRTGMTKKIFTEMINAGVPDYEVPEDIMVAQLCFVGGRIIEKSSRAELDSLHFEWKRQWGPPKRWHEDSLEVKHLEVYPKPIFNGTNIPGSTPPIGKYGGFYPTENNLTIVGTAAPDQTDWEIADTLQIIPDSFSHYLVYGILAEIFSADGETRDAQRALYCRTRWEEGISLANVIIEEEFEDAQ